MLDGVRSGRCVRFHASGQFASDTNYEDDYPAGEAFTWYDSGTTSSYGLYDGPKRRVLLYREYNPAGVLVKEVDERENWRLRYWTDSGDLVYESTDISTCYVAGGNWVIREQNTPNPEDRKPPEYKDDDLYEHAFSILAQDLDLLKYPILRWLHTKLDKNEARAKQLLFDMVDHPTINIAETALQIIGLRGYTEAIPLVRRVTQSKRRKDPRAGGFIGTTSELAEITLVKLTVPDEAEQKVALAAVQRRLGQRERREAEEEKKREARRLKVKRRWPQVEAKFKETLIGELTLKSGDQLFSDEAKERTHEYWHFYHYVVAERSYRAYFITTEAEAPAVKMLRYRDKSPAEYIFDQ